ncbi:MAG: ABC-F family ATP-binding cassette domain-containing protein [Anaerolineales bacterium]|nr:ABC-F family ATP-binding cassette domain-containing protein [Anaerolineales bacterium]MDW8446664.1 ABC-F family ATP-binding cassette domain-containing protein [Anaerolineales bacterium]
MSYLTARNLSKSFGAKDLFKGLSLSVPPQGRIAIVGPNGIGKTTLIRILIGLEEPTQGTVQRARNVRIGYLPQEPVAESHRTLWEECLEALVELRQLEAELRRLEWAMSQPNPPADILERYGALQATFEHRGGYHYETVARQTLRGLGFLEEDFSRPLTRLSSGQRTRALLARLLISQPDLLVLDEPTNHLDIQAVEWLEGYLSQWKGAVLMVSHDRYFLDRVANTIWEMSERGIEIYRGNYSAYLRQREERWSARRLAFETEKERLAKELEYIRRNISGQNAPQAKGRLRRISRLLEAIERSDWEALRGKKWSEIAAESGASSQMLSVEEVTQRVRALTFVQPRQPQLGLRIVAGERSGDLVLRTFDLKVGYAGESSPLIEVPDLVLKRGECVALIGPNGAGKSTFLRTILGDLPPLSGEVRLGAGLRIAYFAQAHEGLSAANSVAQEIETVAPTMLPAEVRNYLARFGFCGEDVLRPVSTLSGGERTRLALAKLCLSGANLLLLDEPTNHLDIPSQEVLQEALSQYQGTVLLVSHDRYLIDALATQIWEVLPEARRLRAFQGSYTEYRLHLEAEKSARSAAAGPAPKNAPNRREGHLNSQRQHLLRLRELEESIAKREIELATLERKLENPPPDPAQVQKLGNEYVRLQAEIDRLLEEWERLQERT